MTLTQKFLFIHFKIENYFIIINYVDYRFRLGGFSCYDHLYKKKIEEIELKNSPMFLKTIQVKYNYKTIVKRKPNIKYFDLFIDLKVPEAIFKEIKYFRIFE